MSINGEDVRRALHGTGVLEGICLTPECCEELARCIEKVLVTSRGIAVRAPSQCMRPTAGRDVDVVGVALPIAAVVGTRVVVAQVVAADGYVSQVKGVATRPVVTAPSVNAPDPYSQVTFSLEKNGTPFPPYTAFNFPHSGGLAALTAATVSLKDGEVVELIATRTVATAGVTVVVSGRLKGWEYAPVGVTGDRITGDIAY